MISPEQFADQLRRAIEIIKENDPPLRIASYDTLGKQSLRIFTEGKNSSGSAIGQYNSTDPLYLNPKTAFNGAKLGKPVGKTGKTKFKSGKDHVTVFVESYKSYREKIGRKTGSVNLELSGELKSDMENPQGGAPAPTRVSEHEYIVQVKRPLSLKKIEGNEARFGTIFKLTSGEKDNFFTRANFELKKILAGG